MQITRRLKETVVLNTIEDMELYHILKRIVNSTPVA